MADIGNQLGKASEDLTKQFTNMGSVVETFASGMQESMEKLAESMGVAIEDEEKRKKQNDRLWKIKLKEFRLVKGLTKAWQKITPLMNKFHGLVSKLTAKIPGLNKLGKGGLLGAMATGIGLFVKQLVAVSDMFAGISKDTGLIGKNLTVISGSVTKASAGLQAWGISVKDVGKQASALVDSLGNANKVTPKLLDVTSRIAKATGMSAQEAANLSSNLMKGFGQTAGEVETFTQSMMHFATNSGVNARKVMRDISNDSNLTAIYLGRGEDYMAKTAILAAKMGKSMADNMATTDAFLNIESGSDLAGRINQFFGSNLNSLKMYNMAIKGDTLGTFKELNKVFSTPRGMAQLEKYPGLAKQLGNELGLTIKDMKNMNKVIADFEGSQKGASKEQESINKYISDAMTLWEKVKAILSASVVPLFNSLAGTLHGDISPVLERAQKRAAEIGKTLHGWGQSLASGYETLKGWANTAFSMIDALKSFGITNTMMAGAGAALVGGTIVTMVKAISAMALRGTMAQPMVVRDVGMGIMGGKRGKMRRAYGTARAGGAGRMSAAKSAVGVGAASATKAATGGGGFMGLLKNAGSMLKPKNLLKVLKKLPGVGWVITAAMGIWQLIDAFKTGNWLQIIPTVMGVLGGILGGAAGSLAGPLGTVGGAVGGSMGGEALGNWLIGAKQGAVVNQPTMFMAGEEGLPELIVPTGRIARGMPIDKGVADTLGAMGMPGYARGVSQVSAAAVAAAQTTGRRQSQQQSIYSSQGDPNAIKRREQKIEQQAAADRAAQRDLVNKIMKENEKLAREQYFSDSAMGAGGPPGAGGRGGGAQGKGPGRDWGKTMHNLAKGLDNFMKLTNTTWKDMWDVMPDKIANPIEGAFNKLPDNIKEGLTTGVETAWDHYLDTGNLQEALAMGAAAGIREATAQSGEFTKAAGNIVAGMLEGESWRKGLGKELTKSLNTKGSYMNTQLEKLNSKASDELKDNERQIKWRTGRADFFKKQEEYYKEQGWTQMADEYGKKAKKVTSDMRKEALKSAGKQALASGGAAALTSGISTFAETGSFKEAGKSALISGGGAAASAGVTAALSATPLAPIAPLLGSVAGSLVTKGLGALFGGGKKAILGAAARAKVLGPLAGALRMAQKPGGEQLYAAFKSGSGGNKLAKQYISAAMQNSEGQPDEGLKGELVSNVGSVVSRTTGVQFSSNEVMSLLSAMQGTGMMDHEQKTVLTNFERRIEGVGARGAIVNRPTVALIGEAGPEAVTPLDQTPGNAPLGGGGDLVQEIRQMNSLLKQVVTNPPPVNLDGQRVSRVLNSVNSDDIRTGVSTVNSRV